MQVPKWVMQLSIAQLKQEINEFLFNEALRPIVKGQVVIKLLNGNIHGENGIICTPEEISAVEYLAIKTSMDFILRIKEVELVTKLQVKILGEDSMNKEKSAEEIAELVQNEQYN